jgi:hypothetical protein
MLDWLFGGDDTIENTSISPEQVQEYMQPVQDIIGQQQGTIGGMQGTIGQFQDAYGQSMGFAEQMMDPKSQHNIQQRRMLEQQGNKSLALQNLLARRQSAALGQSSGITAAQQRGATAAMGRDINQQWQQGLNQQYMQGLGQFNQSQGLLGQIGGMQQGIGSLQGQMGAQQLGIQENIAQADIARRNREMELAAMQQNQGSDFWGGLLGGAATAFGTAVGGPVGGAIGGALGDAIGG